MPKKNQLLTKIVTEAYDTCAETGDEFIVADVIERVMVDPTLASCADEILAAAVSGAVKTLDQKRTKSEALGLFGDVDQVVALGEGKRRRRGSLRATDTLAHLALIEANESQVIAAADRERERIALVLPYQLHHNCTWEDAEAKYLADNPEADR